MHALRNKTESDAQAFCVCRNFTHTYDVFVYPYAQYAASTIQSHVYTQTETESRIPNKKNYTAGGLKSTRSTKSAA